MRFASRSTMPISRAVLLARSFWFTLVLTHQMAVSLFRFIGALARSQVVASSVGCVSITTVVGMNAHRAPGHLLSKHWYGCNLPTAAAVAVNLL